jgi:hypothetical protein
MPRPRAVAMGAVLVATIGMSSGAVGSVQPRDKASDLHPGHFGLAFDDRKDGTAPDVKLADPKHWNRKGGRCGHYHYYTPQRKC